VGAEEAGRRTSHCKALREDHSFLLLSFLQCFPGGHFEEYPASFAPAPTKRASKGSLPDINPQIRPKQPAQSNKATCTRKP
jgi:hypothetical protein